MASNCHHPPEVDMIQTQLPTENKGIQLMARGRTMPRYRNSSACNFEQVKKNDEQLNYKSVLRNQKSTLKPQYFRHIQPLQDCICTGILSNLNSYKTIAVLEFVIVYIVQAIVTCFKNLKRRLRNIKKYKMCVHVCKSNTLWFQTCIYMEI